MGQDKQKPISQRGGEKIKMLWIPNKMEGEQTAETGCERIQTG